MLEGRHHLGAQTEVLEVLEIVDFPPNVQKTVKFHLNFAFLGGREVSFFGQLDGFFLFSSEFFLRFVERVLQGLLLLHFQLFDLFLYFLVIFQVLQGLEPVRLVSEIAFLETGDDVQAEIGFFFADQRAAIGVLGLEVLVVFDRTRMLATGRVVPLNTDPDVFGVGGLV